LGLTFDFNYVGDGVQFPSDNTLGAPRNILIKDCVFKNIKNATVVADSTRQLFVAGSNDVNNLAKNIRYINNSCDAAIAGDHTNGEYAIMQFAHVDGGMIIGNSIYNIPQIKQCAVLLYGYNRNIVIANNTFHNNDPEDIIVGQSDNLVVTGNVFSNIIRIGNSNNATLANNSMYRMRMTIDDNGVFDVDNAAVLRTSRNVMIAGNTFDSSPSTSGFGSNNETITIEYDSGGDGENPLKDLVITGNQGKIDQKFVNLAAAPNILTAGANQNVVISNNHVVERSEDTTDFAIFRVAGNTALTTTSEGWKNVFIVGNYCGPLETTGAAGGWKDVELSTAAMGNIVVRDNWFNAVGVFNVDSYPYAAQNFGTTTTSRYTNSGTVSITTTATTVVVTHGVEYTPAAYDIYVTPTTGWGTTTKFWVDTITATTFTIHRNATVSETMTFAWQVARRT